MGAIPQRNTRPELLVRRALHHRGMRFRLHRRELAGTPDIVFPRARVAVFVDGDFWHGLGWQARGYSSLGDQFARNRGFWEHKLMRNMERDAEVTKQLARDGWIVVRLLESEVRADLGAAVQRVIDAVRTRPAPTSAS